MSPPGCSVDLAKSRARDSAGPYAIEVGACTHEERLAVGRSGRACSPVRSMCSSVLTTCRANAPPESIARALGDTLGRAGVSHQRAASPAARASWDPVVGSRPSPQLGSPEAPSPAPELSTALPHRSSTRHRARSHRLQPFHREPRTARTARSRRGIPAPSRSGNCRRIVMALLSRPPLRTQSRYLEAVLWPLERPMNTTSTPPLQAWRHCARTSRPAP